MLLNLGLGDFYDETIQWNLFPYQKTHHMKLYRSSSGKRHMEKLFPIWSICSCLWNSDPPETVFLKIEVEPHNVWYIRRFIESWQIFTMVPKLRKILILNVSDSETEFWEALSWCGWNNLQFHDTNPSDLCYNEKWAPIEMI